MNDANKETNVAYEEPKKESAYKAADIPCADSGAGHMLGAENRDVLLQNSRHMGILFL